MANLVDGFVTHLGDSSLDLRSKLNVVIEIRDAVEIGQITADAEKFVPELLPLVMSLLEEIPVSMVANSPQNKMRHCLLDILSRIQPNDALKPHAHKILDMAVQVVRVDNEENGILCMKIVASFHRFYKAHVVDAVQPFVQLVVSIIANSPNMVKEYFDDLENGGGDMDVDNDSQQSLSAQQGQQQGHQADLVPAIKSFKVLTECPIIIVLLFTTHRQITTNLLPQLVPKVLSMLSLEAKPQAMEHSKAASQGTYFAGVSLAIRNSNHRTHFTDLIIAQIKFVSFVAFVLRVFPPALLSHVGLVPAFVIRLLKDCPPEACPARKELLVSFRHILNTEHRTHFLNHIELLLEERVLIGCGLTAKHTLRPLAYSTVADLIHHMRNDLVLPQIIKAIKVYSNNLGDPQLGAHFQAMSIKLLINTLEKLSTLPFADQGRPVLLLVLNSVVNRLAIVNSQGSERAVIAAKAQNIIHITTDTPPNMNLDSKFMFRNLVLFLKSLAFGLKASNPAIAQGSTNPQWKETARIFDASSIQLFRNLFREVLKGLKLFSDDHSSGRELMDAVVGFYMQLDVATFNEIFIQEIDFLVNKVTETPSLLQLTYLLTGNETTSPPFCTILLNHLMSERFEQLGDTDTGNTILRLFKQCFSAINLFSAANEQVILPHLKTILVKSLELANDSKEPVRYFALLQSLFRTLGGGRFDSAYKTVLPLLHFLLEILNKRLSNARLEEERNVYAELCLTVPVRLSLLVPHLSYLMKPLVQALNAKSNPELVTQGLRTLELCVDNLTATYFDPHIEPVLNDIMPALFSNLKPLPYDHKLSHITLRVLGKLGGRSRAYASAVTPNLKYTAALDQDLAVDLVFNPDVKAPLKVTPAIKSALRVLEGSPQSYSAEVRRSAYNVLCTVLLKHIPTTLNGLNADSLIANMRGHVKVEELVDAPPLCEAKLDKDLRIRATELVEKLLDGVFMSCCDPELRNEAFEKLCQIGEHVMLLELGEFNTERRRALRPFNVNEFEGMLFVPPRTFVNSIVHALSSHLNSVMETGFDVIRHIAKVGRQLCGEGVEAHRYPLFRGIFAKLSHSCFEEAWYAKKGAVNGLSIVLREIELPKSWLGGRLVELARTLFFVIKDTSTTSGTAVATVPSSVANDAADLLLYMIKQVEYNQQDRYFSLLTSLLAYELESSCSKCRVTAQEAIKYLAEATNTTVSKVLEPVTDIFLTPIFMKPLRALPFPMQIGYIDAISFCLTLPEPIIKYTDELNRLLEEAIALVDAEDKTLTSTHRVFEYTTSQQLTELRVVCIKLLSLAIIAPQSPTAQVLAMRSKIIQVFFRIMGNGTQPAVDAAYDGLKKVLDVSHKLPKELLQACLKPILLPLSDFRRLSLNMLSCLTKLLELLSYNFRVEIGNKLISHLNAFSEPARLLSLSNKVLEVDDKIGVGAALVNVFHMLPAGAHIYIPDLVFVISSIETTLRRSQTSPFRTPLARFINKCPLEALEYFKNMLHDAQISSIFISMIAEAPELRSVVEQNLTNLFDNIATANDEDSRAKALVNFIPILLQVTPTSELAVKVISSLSQLYPAINHTETTNSFEYTVPLALTQMQTVVAELLKTEMSMDLYVSMVSVVYAHNYTLRNDVYDTCWNSIVDSLETKKAWFNTVLPIIADPNANLRVRTNLIKDVNILLSHLVDEQSDSKESALSELCNATNLVDQLHNLIWLNADALLPPEGTIYNPKGSGVGSTTVCDLYLNLFETSILLLKHAKSEVFPVRKDVIKFGWRYITFEDTISKLSAYVLINYFVATFETSAKVVVQIYMALLKVTQQEGRSLVQQSLDVLSTVLADRIQSPLWARAPRRVLSEDGHSVIGVSNVCLFLAKHARLFYPHRDFYIPFIVSAMARLSHMSSQTLDVDFAELLAEWESIAHESTDADADADADTEKYEIPPATKEAVITYLIRFITAQPARASRDPRAALRVLDALDTLLKYWPETHLEIGFFDRALQLPQLNASPQTLQAAYDALRVINVAIKNRSEEWVVSHVNELAAVLEKPLQSHSQAIQEILTPILENILAKDPTFTIHKLILNALNEHISPNEQSNLMSSTEIRPDQNPPKPANPNTPVASTAASIAGYNKHVWVYLAMVAVKAVPTCLDENIALLIKATSRLAKERAEFPSTNSDPTILINALSLIASRVEFLGDQRRSFLTLIAHVVERVQDKSVSTYILDTLKSWIFGTEAFPTIKEKAALLHKLLVCFKDPELLSSYFDLIVGIFEDSKLRPTELPARLEQPFLVGCMSQPNADARRKLLNILNESVDDRVGNRLVYILAEQNWEALADKNWLTPAISLLLSVIVPNQKLQLSPPLGFAPVEALNYSLPTKPTSESMEVDASPEILEFIAKRKQFLTEIDEMQATEFVHSFVVLLNIDNDLTHNAWINLFPSIFKNSLNESDRLNLVQNIVLLFSKEYHLRQCNVRGNVIETLFTGLTEAKEPVPPQLAKYLATNYGAWFPALQTCESMPNIVKNPTPPIVKANDDTLAEIYAALGEDDHFYGHWRSKSKFTITSAALSYEQCGMWTRAMQLHENAQLRARSGTLPFGESEYGLWEDHWILCAEKLQHWEILADVARHEGFTDLLLECQWRLSDWLADKDSLSATIRSVMDVPTPRRQVFETLLTLQGSAQKTEALQYLSQSCDEGIQLTLCRWNALPSTYCHAHDALLHTFQQFVEFMEAAQVYTSLQATNALNLESKSQELKGVMQAWHDRLPNSWDDINMWSDLAAWRQHVFGVVNRVYLPLVPQLQSANGGNSATSSAAYRGYHEIAWTINRFAHTARKQNLPDVCVTQLSKIYTLPNIEIQEAFLKLREQAKCHLQNPNELATGLDVIVNTNLAFFGSPQKSEFFALKGESLARLDQDDHANAAFSTAVQIDVYLPKAWASWGAFNDANFEKKPVENASAASAAAVCYLHAAGLYKNHKSRKLLGRLLWLLAIDSGEGVINACENFNGETPVWFWVSFIPQLLTSLSQKEARFTSEILAKIAKAFPQALHFHLRTARDEYSVLQRLEARKTGKPAQPTENDKPEPAAASSTTATTSSTANSTATQAATAQTKNEQPDQTKTDSESAMDVDPSPELAKPELSDRQSAKHEEKKPVKTAWNYADDVMSTLKTAFPLLALSLETLVDQMHHRFKSPADEDNYRLIIALLDDGLNFVGRQNATSGDPALPPNTIANVKKFAESVIVEATRPQFEADFVDPVPTADVYISRLRKWRNRLEAKLDARPYRINLEALSPPLGEFHYQKFEDIEIPGQWMNLTDDNHYFLKISRFLPYVDLVRSYGICYRRLAIKATDGTSHHFAIQYPAARNCRREERVSQVFKVLSKALDHSPQTRKRNLHFNIPNAIPLNMYIRMVEDNAKQISFYQIYEKFCSDNNKSRDEPFDYQIEQLRQAFDPSLTQPDIVAVKMEILAGIQANIVPPTIMRDYFLKEYRSYADFWKFRREFAYSYAATSFMTIALSANNRYPHKFHVDYETGTVSASDLLPLVPQLRSTPTYLNGEPVAFRFTPNIQKLLGTTVTEGILAPSMMIIAKALSSPEFEMRKFLPVFVRDEIISWFAHQINHSLTLPQGLTEQGVIDATRTNVEAIERRANTLLQPNHLNAAANQTVLDLISLSVNPKSLASTDILWMPFF